jgi:hypothetical protein
MFRKVLVSSFVAIFAMSISPAKAFTGESPDPLTGLDEALEVYFAEALWTWNATVAQNERWYEGVKHARWHAEQEKLAQEKAEREQFLSTTTTTTASVAPTVVETTQAPQAAPVVSGSVWDSLAQCESGGNWSINTGNGYYGGLQFSLSSWNAVGGTGLPSDHSRETQIAMGERLKNIQGWGAWPACSAKLGLR